MGQGIGAGFSNTQQQQQQQLTFPPNLFGLVIPGQIVQYSFEQIGDKGVLTIPNPRSVNVISFFLNQPLGNDQVAASLYFSVPPYEGLEFIGAIADQRPSDIFHTSWSLNPLVNIHQELKLVVQIESIDKIETCIRIKQETDLNKEFAKKVAMNLFNFMQSFNKNDNTQGDGLLVVPLNTFDKWLDKFMRKYELDPNFVFKSE
eukprot:403330782